MTKSNDTFALNRMLAAALMALLLVPAILLLTAASASASGSCNLNIGESHEEVGGYIVFTGHATVNCSGFPEESEISIYDETAGSLLRTCAPATSCSAQFSPHTGSNQVEVIIISNPPTGAVLINRSYTPSDPIPVATTTTTTTTEPTTTTTTTAPTAATTTTTTPSSAVTTTTSAHQTTTTPPSSSATTTTLTPGGTADLDESAPAVPTLVPYTDASGTAQCRPHGVVWPTELRDACVFAVAYNESEMVAHYVFTADPAVLRITGIVLPSGVIIF